jgi:hypothetical protein
MRQLLVVFFLVLASVLPANAQTFRGAINGTVTDPSGASVPDATVKAIDTATNIERATATTGDGQFAFQDLPIGVYKLTVTASGFPTFSVDKVEVTAGTVYTLPLKLSLGQQATTVEVSAATLTIDTTTETQTTLVSGTAMQQVPLNGRDFTQLIAVTPGFAGYSAGGYGSLNGTRANQINWQIDGVDNNDLWHNIPAVNQGGVSAIAGIVLPVDSIEEFSAQTQSAPDTGRNPGGTVNLALKAGGNQFHGSLYYFNRNEAYSVTPPFRDDKPKMRNYQYGGSGSGPIWKDHTFFFASFEKQRFTIGIQGLATEPTTAYQALSQQLLNYYGVSANQVTSNLLASGGLWPEVALTGAGAPNNYASADPEFGYSYNGLVKLDHKINDRNTISFHWFAGQGNQVAPVGTNLLYYYEGAPIHVQNYALVWNSTLSSRLTNQLMMGVNYFNQVFYDFNNGFNMGDYGLYLSPSFDLLGASNMRITGFDQTGRTPPSGRNDITGHLNEVLSFTTGKHQFRFGGEFRQAQLQEFYHRGALGRFDFTGQEGPWYNDYQNCTGFFATVAGCLPGGNGSYDYNIVSLADFLAGYPHTSLLAVGDPVRQVFVNSFNVFAQDAYQVNRKLSLNYGLRYDYVGPFHNDKKDLSTFSPSMGGLVFQGDGISNLFPADKNNFSPRAGFAYRVKEDSDLVVRGGVGLFFDAYNLNPFLDNRPGNNGPNGVESNPAGPSPVQTIEIDSLKDIYSQGIPYQTYIWPAAGLTCASGNNCQDSLGNHVIYNIFSVSQDFKSAYFYNYNLNIEKGLGRSAVASIGYVGAQGRKLLTLADINQPLPGVYNTSAERQAARPYNSQFNSFGVINQVESNGTSNYNSLQATLKIKEWHRATAQFAYTWAHSLDEMSQYRGSLPQDSRNLKGDYGNSDFDTRHNLTALVNYRLPSADRWKLLLNGWQVSSLLSFHTGQPFTVYTGSDNSGAVEGFQRPNLIGDPFAGVSHKIQTDSSGSKFVQWINPAAFAQPEAGTFGNLARNKYYGPGFGSVDFSIYKDTKIGERIGTQLRVEMFNLFNRVNLAPLNNYTGGGFGQIADTVGDWNGAPGIGPGEPFNMQLAFKIIF